MFFKLRFLGTALFGFALFFFLQLASAQAAVTITGSSSLPVNGQDDGAYMSASASASGDTITISGSIYGGSFQETDAACPGGNISELQGPNDTTNFRYRINGSGNTSYSTNLTQTGLGQRIPPCFAPTGPYRPFIRSFSFPVTVSSTGYIDVLANNAYGSSFGMKFNYTYSGGNPASIIADIKANGSDGPITITSGQSAQLTWSSSISPAGTPYSCSVTNGGSGTSGSANVFPTSTTTYTITCSQNSNPAISQSDSVTVNVNAQQQSTSVSCSVSPSSLNISAGGSGTYNVSISSSNYSGSVSLNPSGLPSGGSMSPYSGSVSSNGSTQASMTLFTSSSTPSGTYTINFNLSSSAQSNNSCSASLTVSNNPPPPPPPSGSTSVSCLVNNPSMTLAPGNSGTFSVTVSSNNYTGNVTVNASGLPSGASINPYSQSISAGGSFNAPMTILTSTSTPSGTYTIFFNLSSGAQTNNGCSGQLTISSSPPTPSYTPSYAPSYPSYPSYTPSYPSYPSYTPSYPSYPSYTPSYPSYTPSYTPATFFWNQCGVVGNPSQTTAVVAQGGSVSFQAQAVPGTGFNAPVTASGAMISGTPAGMTVTTTSTNPQTVAAPSTSPIFTFRIDVAPGMPTGTWTVNFTATGGSITRTNNTCLIQVTSTPDFALNNCNPVTNTVAPGQSISYSVSVASSGGFNQPITLNASLSPSAANPPTLSVSAPNPFTPPVNGSVTKNITATTTTTTTPGTYTISVSGTSGGTTRNCAATMQLIVSNYDYTVTPSLTFNAVEGGGNPPQQNISVQNIGNANITNIAISRTFTSPASPPAPWLSFTIASVSVTAGGTTTVGVNATPNALPAGTYIGQINFTHPQAGNRTTIVTLNVSSSKPNVPTNVTADNSTCGSIRIAWGAPSGGQAVTGYRVYRRSSTTAPWGSAIYQKPNTSAPLEYVDGAAAATNNYYAVAAYNTFGESPYGEPSLTPVAKIPCAANLSSSSKDIIGVNGDTYSATACNGITDALPLTVSIKTDDIVTFRIGLCNTGTAAATNLSVEDTLTNAEFVTGQTVAYGGTCAGAGQPGVSADLKTISFASLPSIPAPPANSCLITFQAKVTAPTTSANSVFSFQNKAVATFNDGTGITTKTVLTPPFLFGKPPKDPELKEVAP